MEANNADASDGGSRAFAPMAEDWRSFAWNSGGADTAWRPHTARVEGCVQLRRPTLFALLSGGSRRIDVRSECGHRFAGRDFAGSVSFVATPCARHVSMMDVESRWVSLSIRQDCFIASDAPDDTPPTLVPFTNATDRFLHALLHEIYLALVDDTPPDPMYCDAMAQAAARHLLRRQGAAMPPADRALPPWRLRRIEDYVQARLDDPVLRLGDIARHAGLSTGFFHRAFKQTTGETPLAYVQRLRLQHAMHLLSAGDDSVIEVALQVGFQSPSHFARLFQRSVGVTPSAYRRGRR